jgi:hypothetical protein
VLLLLRMNECENLRSRLVRLPLLPLPLVWTYRSPRLLYWLLRCTYRRSLLLRLSRWCFTVDNVVADVYYSYRQTSVIKDCQYHALSLLWNLVDIQTYCTASAKFRSANSIVEEILIECGSACAGHSSQQMQMVNSHADRAGPVPNAYCGIEALDATLDSSQSTLSPSPRYILSACRSCT